MEAVTETPAIVVCCLSKCYQIYDKPRDRLAQALWQGRRKFYREFWRCAT
jgi:lipopolysaccharide transport system ATP-binding protein